MGKGRAPVWYSVLECAAEWGQPPWIIAGGSPVIWFMRWRWVHNERAKASHRKAKNRELQANAFSQGL